MAKEKRSKSFLWVTIEGQRYEVYLCDNHDINIYNVEEQINQLVLKKFNPVLNRIYRHTCTPRNFKRLATCNFAFHTSNMIT